MSYPAELRCSTGAYLSFTTWDSAYGVDRLSLVGGSGLLMAPGAGGSLYFQAGTVSISFTPNTPVTIGYRTLPRPRLDLFVR
jgi:hypothetical protein